MTDGAPPQASDRVVLEGSNVAIPPLGVGTWAWGDKSTWGMGGYDASLSEATITEAWEACLQAGIVFFDTAEVYGGGESERIIGRLLARDPAVRPRVVIATKFMPSPWKVNVTSALVSAARRSRERLGVDTIDLYQIHGPISLRSPDAIADALAAARAEGIVRAVGAVGVRDRDAGAGERPQRVIGRVLVAREPGAFLDEQDPGAVLEAVGERGGQLGALGHGERAAAVLEAVGHDLE